MDRAARASLGPGPAMARCALLSLEADEMASASARAGFVPPC